MTARSWTVAYTFAMDDRSLVQEATGAPLQLGMLLLTGGESRRYGAPKHLQSHPEGGTWAGHLAKVFEELFPVGPVQILGAPIQERPELGSLDDPHLGPARALAHWAALAPQVASHWWVVACDQIRWTTPRLAHWLAAVQQHDPKGEMWILADHEGRTQYLGGILGARLLPLVAASRAASLRDLAAALPCCHLPADGPEWRDVDCPKDLSDLAYTPGN